MVNKEIYIHFQSKEYDSKNYWSHEITNLNWIVVKLWHGSNSISENNKFKKKNSRKDEQILVNRFYSYLKGT